MKTTPVLFAVLAIALLSGCGSTSSGPAAPANVLVKQAFDPGSVAVSFDWTATGEPATFTVTGTPNVAGAAPVVATGTSSPILVTGLTARAGYTFSVAVATGGGSASTTTGLLRFYSVVETFHEPMTQPNDTVFTGTFTFDVTNKAVTGLVGSLTQAMTKHDNVYGPPMTEVPLTYQLSAAATTLGGVQGMLVTAFAANTTNTFDPSGFAPGGTEYYGLAQGAPNPKMGGFGNAYAMIFVNTTDPTAPLDQAQIDKLAYGDCTAGGMMMNTCMTGTTTAGYGRMGTMMGQPVSQVVTEQ
ncbi:MAG TPA: hypothetical protein VFM53_06395 [Anaeromyxobacteraceae bacterium]|nr:hypothetical protein [Anaeromyxobacteraceae bacterium]